MTTSQSFYGDRIIPVLFWCRSAFDGTPKPKQVLMLDRRCVQKTGCMESMQSVRFSSSIEIHDNGLFFREFADSVLGAFFAYAAVLDAAVRHVVHAEAGAVVDDDAACFDMLGCVVGDGESACEDAGLQAVAGVVDAGDGFFNRVVGDDREDGGKCLVLTTFMSGVTSVRMVGS